MTDETLHEFVEKFDLDCNGSFDEVDEATHQTHSPGSIHPILLLALLRSFPAILPFLTIRGPESAAVSE
jgi:hypothetical protein